MFKVCLHLGRVAEWLCRGLQILVRRFDSGPGLQMVWCKKATSVNFSNFATNFLDFNQALYEDELKTEPR